MVEQVSDYRQILQKELTDRCESNPRYSLRAFARDLKIAPSRLSEILNHKQGLSRRAAESITRALGYGPEEMEYFCDLVSLKHARSVKEREDAKIRVFKADFEKQKDEPFSLQADSFKIISDWYHLGILELMKVKNFRHDTKWISRRLGVQIIQIELAVERLCRVGLMKIENGKFMAIQSNGWVPGGVPSSSIRKFHRQVLEKAQSAIETQAVEERFFSTHLLTVNRSDLPCAFKAIREFQDKFCVSLQSDTEKELLYCISMQLFKIVEEETV
ncbi:MAG: TIGR02147 family protein [Chitinophagaceae bacterium]|nr:TIGR02147 family protein [Oligoflexus sp.]